MFILEEKGIHSSERVTGQPLEHKKGNGWKLIAENLTKEQCQETLKGAVFDNGSDKTVLKVRGSFFEHDSHFCQYYVCNLHVECTHKYRTNFDHITQLYTLYEKGEHSNRPMDPNNPTSNRLKYKKKTVAREEMARQTQDSMGLHLGVYTTTGPLTTFSSQDLKRRLHPLYDIDVTMEELYAPQLMSGGFLEMPFYMNTPMIPHFKKRRVESEEVLMGQMSAMNQDEPIIEAI